MRSRSKAGMPESSTAIRSPLASGQRTGIALQVSRDIIECATRPSGSSASLAEISPQNRPSRLTVRMPAMSRKSWVVIVKRLSASVSQTKRIGWRRDTAVFAAGSRAIDAIASAIGARSTGAAGAVSRSASVIASAPSPMVQISALSLICESDVSPFSNCAASAVACKGSPSGPNASSAASRSSIRRRARSASDNVGPAVSRARIRMPGCEPIAIAEQAQVSGRPSESPNPRNSASCGLPPSSSVAPMRPI